MARNSNRMPVRMGVLNLLVMVVALCLAVLAVLSLVTAQAGEKFNRQQEETIRETYAVELVGQHLLADVDDALHFAIATTDSKSQILPELEDSLFIFTYDVSQLPEIEQYGIETSVEVLSAEELKEALRVDLGINQIMGGVVAKVTTASNYQLNCILGIDVDENLEVLQWKSAKQWSLDDQAEQLYQTS